jgi:predicted ThiF/HesA family dinucleotide-utilizing enzyme
MTSVSTSELSQEIANKVSASVNSNIATLIVNLFGDRLWVPREEYGRIYGVSNTYLQKYDSFLRKNGALKGEHKAQRYNRLFNVHTGKSIFEAI